MMFMMSMADQAILLAWHYEYRQAMDCGSGHDFVLPHLSSADREGPNKLLDNVSTVPMKVCNGLVHGDRRSHVILSPGVIGATANHAIECLIVMINDVLEVHGVMPDVFTLQSDGASTNKNILMLAFLALLVMEGVFRTARLCMELEHHAHDVYDAYQAIHAGLVRRSTFFYLEELIHLIEAAHESSGDREAQQPVVGHDVKVSNLWEVRDFWEWLAPGYTEESTRPYALANAAFSCFPLCMDTVTSRSGWKLAAPHRIPRLGFGRKPT